MLNERKTAKVYAFPKGGRMSLKEGREDRRMPDLTALNLVPSVAGSGWYHENAINDAQSHKR